MNARLRVAQRFTLTAGQHTSALDGACLLEAVAYVAGEPWSDEPACACPVLAGLLRGWNDALHPAQRQTLKRYMARLVGSRGTDEQTDERTAIVRAHSTAAGVQAIYRSVARLVVDDGTDADLDVLEAQAVGQRRVNRRTLAALHALVEELLAVTERPAPTVVTPTVTAAAPAPLRRRRPRRPIEPAVARDVSRVR